MGEGDFGKSWEQKVLLRGGGALDPVVKNMEGGI